MRVCWTDTSLAHLDAIHAFIARDSLEYAQRVVDRLTRRSEQIASFPLAGRLVPEAGFPQIREVIEGPYRIIYYIKPDQIEYWPCFTARSSRLGLQHRRVNRFRRRALKTGAFWARSFLGTSDRSALPL